MAPTAPKPPTNNRTSTTQSHAPHRVNKSCCDSHSDKLVSLNNIHNINLAHLQFQHALDIMKLRDDHTSEMLRMQADHINETNNKAEKKDAQISKWQAYSAKLVNKNVALTHSQRITKDENIVLTCRLEEQSHNHRITEDKNVALTCLLDEQADKKKVLEDELEMERATKTCQICLTEPQDCIFLGCGHLVCCRACVTMLPYERRVEGLPPRSGYKQCPVCRKWSRQRKVFVS